jgi:hypothetical protein
MKFEHIIFKEIPSISKKTLLSLYEPGFMSAANVPYSWAYMSDHLKAGFVTEKEVKYLIHLEINRKDGKPPRLDMVERFMRYVNRRNQKDLLELIETTITNITNQ